ncbi:Bridging integrator 3 [Anabarilius grahami]|uniref:Bridging integrator 3 n=1 Tax=Anabarilius grahami TaxID=495550 RepID=A0A3N0XMH5_ANAGA|nr:Bridging integrator 3 [Anabarilius grahami]
MGEGSVCIPQYYKQSYAFNYKLHLQLQQLKSPTTSYTSYTSNYNKLRLQLQVSAPAEKQASMLEEQTKKLHKDMKKSTEADLAMSKAAVKISGDLLSNPLCEQDQAFLESMNALDTAMKRMDAFNQEKGFSFGCANGNIKRTLGFTHHTPATQRTENIAYKE